MALPIESKLYPVRKRHLWRMTIGFQLMQQHINTFLHYQEHGNGAADASQSEGHESKLTARVTSQTQTEKKTQVHYFTFQDRFQLGF